MGDLFTNGENHRGKIPPSEFKVTTFENLLLSQQAVTSKWILVPYTNLQLNLYPNTQLDLFYSDNYSFYCTAPSTWLTNWCADPNTQLTSLHESQYMTNTNFRRILAAKFFSSSHDEDHESPWLQNPTTYKRSSFLKRKMNLSIRFRFTICLWKNFSSKCIISDGP